MNIKYLQKACALILALFLLSALLFYWVQGSQIHYRESQTVAVDPAAPIGELTRDIELRQPFTAETDEIIAVSVLLSTYARENSSHLDISIEDSAGAVLVQTEVLSSEIADNAVRRIDFPAPVRIMSGAQYNLILTSPDSVSGNAISAWSGAPLSAEQLLYVNGEKTDQTLHYQLHLRTQSWLSSAYWYLVAAATLLMAAYFCYFIRAAKNNRMTFALRMLLILQRYGYLMKQLIGRDFKTRYKRSVLGVCWSFLNPLLTMLVQYIVFSTLFRSDIPNFQLYLLVGIVCFNFFSEATGVALQAIVGNASLITKVYVPKYIYPVSRVLSSGINLLFSVILLFIMMVFTRTPFRPALVFVPFGLICLLALCIGMGFILSTAMVFFRDTQFLWGVVSMLWMYATPIFYPETIIPARLMPLYKCNPMYHVIRFLRTIFLDGAAPLPKAFLFCGIACFVPLLLGTLVFKKNQDKFILNL